MAMTFDDASGRTRGNSHDLLGTDVLFETVRFPVTVPESRITDAEGAYHEMGDEDLKLMETPTRFTHQATASSAMWSMRIPERVLPEYHASHIVYWLEKAFVLPPAHRDLRSRRKVEPHRSAAHEDDS